MKPKAYDLYKIPGLEYTEDENSAHDNWGAYKWRDKWDDMKATKAFYDEYPPEVGDLVVVLHTASGYQMLRPDVKPIIAITKQKRLVVDHIHNDYYAGKSFWRTGQNCKAPKGQCWLVPAELYKDIPFSKPTAPPAEPKLSMKTYELVNAMGGRDAFKERATKLCTEYGLSADEALLQMEKEHEGLMFLHKHNHRLCGRRARLVDIQRHHDHFLAQGKELCKKNRELEQEMLDKGQLRGLSRYQNYVGRKI